MFLQTNVLSVLAVIVLVMNVLGLAFTIHKLLRGDHKTADGHDITVPAHAHVEQRTPDKRLAATH